MMAKKIDVRIVTEAWTTLVKNVGDLGPIDNDRQLDRSVALLDHLLEAVQGDSSHPLEGLVRLVAERIENYETKRFPPASASAAEVLQLLMESNGLKQSDLAMIMGGQSVVSAVLNGHRAINAKQAAALGKYFCMSPVAFIDMPNNAPEKRLSTKPTVTLPAKPPTRRSVAPQAVPIASKARTARTKLAAPA